FFLFFPKQASHLFSGGPQHQQVKIAKAQDHTAVLGASTSVNEVGSPTLTDNVFCPFAVVSLQIVKQVNPTRYSEVASQISCTKAQFLENINAQYLQGHVPGMQPEDLAVFGENGTIQGLKIATSNIEESAITTNLLAPQSVTAPAIANNSVTTLKIAPGAV